MGVEIALLGEITAHVDGRSVDLGPARQRCALAALAVDVGRLVPAEQLASRLWGADTPRRGRATLHSYISRLRGAFGSALAIVNRFGGYTLVVDQADQAVDLLRFRDLCGRARRTAEDTSKVALLTEALTLWRGEPLTGVSGQWVDAERDRWQYERWAAEHDLVDARLRVGHGEDLVAQLSARTALHPLDERVAGQYLLALHRAGRTADALAHYRHLRERLVEELGTDPGAVLQNLHRQILADDPALTPLTAAITGTSATLAEVPVPRQLPAPPRWFTGRDTELARLDQVPTVEPDDDPLPSTTGSGTPPAATVVISAIGGAGGIGKTWLALAWAHQHTERFPDGQLFTDLRGYSPTEQPVTADAALLGFLTALGVAPNRIPADPDTKAALYRSLVAERRMLIVLDNAATADQVTPLLPGSPTCTVLVTSRTRLASLIDRHGARHLQLDVLMPQEARTLLAARLGTDRVAAEPDAVDELVELCGGFPLALSITARTAAARPGRPLAEIATELRELGLEMLDHDTDPAASLPTVLSWSLRRLTDEHRTVFALLGIAPGPDTTLSAVVALTALPPSCARRALSALEEASLLERRPHGRYAMHDLVRAYATTTALPNDVREAALARVMDFHLHTAHAADRLLDPYRPLLRLGPPKPGVRTHSLPDAAAAMAWLEAEHPTLLATQRAAAALAHHHVTWHVAWALSNFHFRRGLRHDRLAVWQAGLAAAEHLPNPTIHTLTHQLVGAAHDESGRHDEAIRHLDQALTLAEYHHDHFNQAETHRMLAWTWGQRRDNRQALEHATHALRIHRTLDNPVWEAKALNAMGWFAARLGSYDRARAHCRAALSLFPRPPPPPSGAAIRDSLGYIEHHTGHYEQAIRYYQQALTLLQEHSNIYQVSESLDGLGPPLAAVGQHSQARAVWREALKLYREQGRDTDVERLQRKLLDLDTHDDNDQPTTAVESAK
jgi:DNA-binding SARP family transcriptional activator/tetratricopeptide (TPR) repeat protein